MGKPLMAYWFEHPKGDISWLEDWPIPPAPYIQQLEEALGQQWFDGACSFVDLCFKGNELLPFWVLTWWRRMTAVIHTKGQWHAADKWAWLAVGLQGKSALDPDTVIKIDHARVLLGVLGWNSHVSVLGANTSTVQFSRLVSEEWLDDNLVDMMMYHLAARAHCDPQIAGSVIIDTLAFPTALLVGAATEDFTSHILKSHVTSVHTSGRKQLFFPFHHGNNHWLAFMIDFANRKVWYGISMQHITPIYALTNIITQVTQWIHWQFILPEPFKHCKNGFKLNLDTSSLNMETIYVMAIRRMQHPVAS